MSRYRLVLLIVVAAVAFELFTLTKVEVDGAVRPYVERCLDLIIEKKYQAVYDTYLKEHALSLDEFSGRVEYFDQVFGAPPKSYAYSRSYGGRVAHFIEYKLTLDNGDRQRFTFSFPAKEGSVIGVDDLEGASASADFGEKQFGIDFESGSAYACSVEKGCHGDSSTGTNQ